MVRLDRQYILCAGAAVVAGLLSVSIANAQSVPDATPLSYSAAQIFAKALRDQPAAADETEWSDFSALAYAQSRRSAPAGVQWLPQPMPAVDGFNAKIDGYGGGANHSSSLYGADGSLSIPLAQQWGLQIDGGVGSFNSSGTARGAGHVFWRDPSVGLLGVYGSYSRWNGNSGVIVPRTALNIARAGAEGEYYLGRWTVGGVIGYETVRFNIPAVVASDSTVDLQPPLLRQRNRKRAVCAVEAADVISSAAIAVDLGVKSVDRRHRLREPLDARGARTPRLRVSQRREIRPFGFVRGGCLITKGLGENLGGGIPQRRGVGHALGVRHRD